MIRYVVCSVLLSSLAACAAPQALTDEAYRERLARDTPYQMLTCHVDPGFSENELADIGAAGDSWSVFSEHHVTISTPADLRFNRAAALQPCTVVRLTSESRLVRDVSLLAPGKYILAFTNGQRIYMISDRIERDQFYWTVAHEMGHALGLKDLSDTTHVMSGMGPFTGTWFDESDKEECRRVRVCP